MEIARVVEGILVARNWTQEQLAAELDTSQPTIARWLKGREPRGGMMDRLRELAVESGVIEEDTGTVHKVPVMGFIGAGAKISPEFEQVPPDGLDQVEVPFPVPKGLIALKIVGDSMYPRYDDGDVLLVHRHQVQSIESLIGQEAAVRTDKGRRYLKRILRGPRARTYNLESFNAPTIEGVRLAWASPIWIVIKAGQLRRLATPRKKR